MKISDIRNLPDDELLSEIQKARQSIFKEKFHAKGAVENPGSVKELKKTVARMLTVLRQRNLERQKQ